MTPPHRWKVWEERRATPLSGGAPPRVTSRTWECTGCGALDTSIARPKPGVCELPFSATEVPRTRVRKRRFVDYIPLTPKGPAGTLDGRPLTWYYSKLGKVWRRRYGDFFYDVVAVYPPEELRHMTNVIVFDIRFLDTGGAARYRARRVVSDWEFVPRKGDRVSLDEGRTAGVVRVEWSVHGSPILQLEDWQAPEPHLEGTLLGLPSFGWSVEQWTSPQQGWVPWRGGS